MPVEDGTNVLEEPADGMPRAMMGFAAPNRWQVILQCERGLCKGRRAHRANARMPRAPLGSRPAAPQRIGLTRIIREQDSRNLRE
jgi:hypothetical protein